MKAVSLSFVLACPLASDAFLMSTTSPVRPQPALFASVTADSGNQNSLSRPVAAAAVDPVPERATPEPENTKRVSSLARLEAYMATKEEKGALLRATERIAQREIDREMADELLQASGRLLGKPTKHEEGHSKSESMFKRFLKKLR